MPNKHESLLAIVALCLAAFACPAGRLEAAAPGQVVAWGAPGLSACEVPEPNTGFVAIAGGRGTSVGLKADGTVVSWGQFANYLGPSGNPGYVAVAAGAAHRLVLADNGMIVAWGDNYYGQLDLPSPFRRYVAIEAGTNYSFAIDERGSIVHWGSDYAYQSRVPEPNEGFIAVTTGYAHNVGLKSDGTIVTWGWNRLGQCDVPVPNASFVAVDAGIDHSLGLKADGRVVAWGDNSHGECNVPRPNENFVAIAAGRGFSVGLKSDGTIVAWGSGSGILDVPAPDPDFVDIAAGENHCLALTRNEPLPPQACRIDVIPRSGRNHVSCRGRGRLIPVAILTDEGFDARQVDVASVRFGPGDAVDVLVGRRHGARSHEADVDGDGDIDVLLHFRFGDTGLQCGDTKVELRGLLVGGRQFAGWDVVDTSHGTDKEDGTGEPSLSLAASPNPFNPQTSLRFALPEPGGVRLCIHDLAGRVVRVLVDDSLSAGGHEFTWDGRDRAGRAVGSGAYLARLETGSGVQVLRLGLVR